MGFSSRGHFFIAILVFCRGVNIFLSRDYFFVAALIIFFFRGIIFCLGIIFLSRGDFFVGDFFFRREIIFPSQKKIFAQGRGSGEVIPVSANGVT